MDDNFNNVTRVEQDLLMSVEDFARQEGVTPRTVYRWIELGRLDTVERLGKKYVNASIPLKSPVSDNDNVRNGVKSQDVKALQQVNIFEEYLKTLRENGARYEKSCRRWQMSCYVSVFLLFAALFAGTTVSLLYHYQNESLSDRLSASAAELAKGESAREAALAEVDDLNKNIEKRLQPYKDENTKLQKRLDEILARNDSLRGQLETNLSQQAIMLQRLSEQSTIDQVVSVDPTSTPDDKKAKKESKSL